MESVKKILPYILIAIVFAIGGYVIGLGNFFDQSAAVFKGVPKNQPSFIYYGSDGTCWINWGDGSVDWEGTTYYDNDGTRHCNIQLKADTQKGGRVPGITVIKPTTKAVPGTPQAK